MKKLTLLSAIAVVTGLTAFLPKVSAQITLDQTDLPTAGLTVVVDSDGTTKPSLGTAQVSSPQSWDFSALLRQKSKTDVFMLPTATKYSSAFATANLADSTIGGNGYNFFNTSVSNFSVVGAEEIVSAGGNNFQIEINLTPPFEQSALPATTTTNNLVLGTASGTETFSKTFSAVITQEQFTDTIVYADTVDAYGTMKMPNGQTYNVLRQKHTETDYEHVYLYSTFTNWFSYQRVVTNKNQFDWYAKNVGFILVEADVDPTYSNIINVWWDTTAPAPLSINEISLKNMVNVYPNPANTQVTFITGVNDSRYISVYDITGRDLEKVAVKNGNAILNTSSYSNGMYLYNVTDNSGNLLDRGKFSVQH